MGNAQTAVLGFGVTGQSVARHCLRQGTIPVVLDTRPQRPVATEFADLDIRWSQTAWPDLAVGQAVLSPGLSLDSCLVKGAREAGVKLVSDIDLFFIDLPEGAEVIGVTGTNGKSTVTAWAGHVLNAAGVDCAVGGNLGDAALDVLQRQCGTYVLELSSFQLERSADLPLAAATVLNVTEDHLDMHGDMAAYQASKHRIYAAAGRIVYSRDCTLTMPAEPENAVSFGLGKPPREQDWGISEINGRAQLCRGMMPVMPADELPLPGDHNLLNALAVCALVEQWVDPSALPAALRSYAGLAHRFEMVAEYLGVQYVNDSKATNLGAAMAALEGLPTKDQVVLIAGGDPKGVDLTPLAGLFPGRVKHVVCLGMAAPELAELAQSVGISHALCTDMAAAVAESARVAVNGDLVLLSPACASLDMFSSYSERGDQFAAAARALADEGSV